MRIFHRRPLALISAVFIAASLLGFLTRAEVKYLLSALLAAAALICVAAFAMGKMRGRRLAFAIALCVSALLALLGSYAYFDLGYMKAQEYRGESCEISGVVLSRRYGNNYSTGYEVRLSEINGRRVSYRVVLDCEFVSDLQPGHTFRAVATPEELGYGEIDKSDRLRAISNGYVLRCVISSDTDCDITGEAGFMLELWFGRLNRRMASMISRDVGGEEGAFAAALGLGRIDLLSNATLRDYRRSGATHMLALSGLHLTLLMGGAELLLRRLRVPKPLRFLLLIGMIFFFLFLTGFAVSANRAATMLIFLYVSLVIAREADPPTSLFLSCAIIIALSPPAIADCGFWLSFAATFGIIVGLAASRGLLYGMSGGRRRRAKKNPAGSGGENSAGGATRGSVAPHPPGGVGTRLYRYVVMTLVSTFSANCAVALCMWLFFGEISAVTLLTNLLLSPVCTFALAVIFLYFLCVGVGFASGAGFLVWIIRHTSSLMLAIAEYFSFRSGAVISLGYPFAGVIIAAMSVVYVVLCVIKLRRKWVMLLPALSACLVFMLCLGVYEAMSEGSVRVSYLNGGRGEMIVISSTEGGVICDISDGGKSHVGAALVEARQNYLTEIDVFVLTHYHQKHISATDSLLGREVVRQIWLPEPLDERERGIMLNLLAVAKSHGCRAVIYGVGDELTIFGEGALSLGREYIKRSTHPVITLFLTLGGERFSYVGASAVESGLWETAAENIAGSREVIFGSHGPISKAGYSCDFDYSLLRGIIFGSDTVLSYFRFEECGDELEGVRLIRPPQRRALVYGGE